VFNHFEEVYDITELALKVKVRNLENSRTEMREHHYQLDHQHLFDLGY
jgi:hypothetical protein